jgi:protein-L-isoaspartate(D-aspartate) O-methyltransferase
MTDPITEAELASRRDQMVRDQLLDRGISHPGVLAAMREVPRHEFVAAAQRALAYDDRPLSVGYGQTISQPYMVAVMTEALDPHLHERVLEVGTGSGYQAAVLARLVCEVISIEYVPELAEQARETLQRLGITNVNITCGDGTLGYPGRQPYDGIMVTAGAPAVPGPLLAQLNEGGRIVMPVGSQMYQELVVIRRHEGQIIEERREGCVFVPLKGKYGWGSGR